MNLARNWDSVRRLMTERWARVPANWCVDLLVVAVVIALLLAARGALMASLWDYAGPTAGTGPVLTALVRGFPFDCRTATIACLPLLVASLTALRWETPAVRRRLRAWWLAVLAGAIVVLTVVDHFYFREYRDQFNHFLFGAVYDDQAAILGTVWKQYPVVRLALAGVATVAATGWLGLRLWRESLPLGLTQRIVRWGWPVQTVVSLGLLAVIICCARGSISRLPAQSKNVAVGPDSFLNKLVLNPFSAMNGAINTWRETRSEADERTFIADGDVRAAAGRWFGPGALTAADLDAASERAARGSEEARRPRQVVIVLLESASGWAFEPRWAPLQLDGGLPGLIDPAASDALPGFHLRRFLSAGPGTIYSVGPVLTGLADTGMMQSYLASCQQPLPTSLAPIFRRLGYRTRLHYSGYLSWQRLGDLVQGQGFDEVHGGGEISNWLSGQEWGVDDEHLLDWVAERIDPAVPSLDVILTTSNHPPYNVDVAAAGYPLREWPAGIEHDGEDTLPILAHHWYGAHCAARFVRQVAARCPSSLFALTGDHFGRRFPTSRPDAFERSAVPLFLVGAGLEGLLPRDDLAGTHLDLIPTLVERCAPAGFRYHAFGHDLLGPDAPTMAVSTVGGISREGAVNWASPEDAQGLTPEELERWRQRSSDLMGLAWWRLMRGAAWK